MVDTVREIANATLDLAGLERITGLLDETDHNARICRRVLDRSGINHARQRNAVGESWSAFNIEANIETAAGQSIYGLPDGFVSFINDTLYIADGSRYPLILVSDPAEWWNITQWHGTNPLSYWYRVITTTAHPKAIEIYPVPSGIENIRYTYITENWLKTSSSEDATLIGRINADNNIPILPTFLIELDATWRIRKELGLDFQTDLGLYEVERGRFLSLDSGGGRRIPIGGRRRTAWFNSTDWRVISS